MASRASRTASPASGKAPTTNAISGPTPDASSSSLARGGSSLKTSAACSPRNPASIRERSESDVTYRDWVSALRADCSRRQKSARATSANGSSSSVWPTASAGDGSKGADLVRRDTGEPNATLPTAVATFQASARPTPTTRDHKGGGTAIVRSDGKIRNDMLDWVAESWSTPRASDGEKGGPNQAFGAGGIPVPAEASQWMTPRSHEVGQYQYSRGDKTKPIETLTGQAMTLGEFWSTPRASENNESWETKRMRNARHLAESKSSSRTKGVGGPTTSMQAEALVSLLPRPVKYPDGATSSPDRRSLNPLFVEWLMGWPPGWTLLAWTDFACSATELSLWKQRMRSALFALGSPAEAPPVQQSLFG